MADKLSTINIPEALDVLRLISTDPDITLQGLADHLDCSRASIVRILRTLREDCDMEIEWTRERGYRIRAWGILSRTRVQRGRL